MNVAEPEPLMVDARFIPQAACIPYRLHPSGSVEILLIRWNQETTWGIPKGLVDPGNNHPETALIEANEEAGVEGTLTGDPLGEYVYPKYHGQCKVLVFAMRVDRVLEEYDERNYRTRTWFPVQQAAQLIARRELEPMILTLGRMLQQPQQ